MELYYEYDNYLKRLKTPLWQEKGRVLYYGIYDFSYKYRTRIFDVDDNEIAYVEKDITAEKPCVEGKEMSRYDDIINLPHHVSPTRQRMSMHDRAAQFAPFAALVGYDDAVAETARLTESRPELDEQEQRAINESLAYIADYIQEQPDVRIKYFVPDEHKSGGAIVEVSGKVKKISATDGTIVMADGNSAAIRDIICISTK